MATRAPSDSPTLQIGMRAVRFIQNIPHFMRLYWRLVCDPRVSIWPKALLALSGLYVLSPIDIIPDVIPFIGEVDDLVIVIAVCRLFIYLCPREVVQEHVRRIDAGV